MNFKFLNVGGNIETYQDLLAHFLVMFWLASNIVAYNEYGVFGCMVSTYSWMAFIVLLIVLKRKTRLGKWLHKNIPHGKERS